jgi:glutamate transport system permease protein
MIIGTLTGLLQELQQQIHRNFLAEDALQLILGGFQNTLVIFFFGAIWALVLAMFLTYLHVNHKWQWLYRPLHWFVATIHDVPAVVLMMFFYYVVFSASLNGILVSIIALGVYTSGTLTKIFKIHIKQVAKEQYEAGRMLGFTPKQIYRLIILPQAVKSMLPLVVGEMKVLLRATSYAGYIAQKDLVKAVDSIRTQTEDVFLPLLFISLLYLFLSWLIVKVFHLLHVKLFCYD